MKVYILLVLFLVGCNYVDNTISDFTKSEEEKEAEKKQTISDLKSADDQITQWVLKLEKEKDSSNCFIHHEGLTEEDPWGNFIEVSYSETETSETLKIISKGPDGLSGTKDDLIRTRETQKKLNPLTSLIITTRPYYWVSYWVIGGCFIYGLFHVLPRKTRRKGYQEFGLFLASIIAAPLMGLVLVVAFIIEFFDSGDGGGFDIFDIFDIFD